MASAEDKVVAEFDVHACNTLLGNSTQLFLFQYPLRPPWRPYDLTDRRTKMRFKPNARRVEVTTPLDTSSENYHYGPDESLRISNLTLKSRPTELACSVALGVFRDGKLFLMPIDAAHRLRPSLDHLNVPTTQPTGRSDNKEVKEDPEATVALQQTVKKRETERQVQARMRSFAYLEEEEAKEAWIDIDLAEEGVEENFYDRLANAPEEQLRTTLSRDTYLTTLLPDPSEQDESARLADANRRSAGGASVSAAAGGTVKTGGASNDKSREPEEPLEGYSGPPLPEAEAKALKKTLTVLLRSYPVVKLRGMRWWLANMPASKTLTSLEHIFTKSDAVLHHAVMQTGLLKYVRQVYVQISTGTADVDTFRQVILEMLATRPAVRKQEVVSAAKEKGLALSDAQYSKAIKEICQSKAAVWTLKPGYAGGVGS